MPAFLVAAVVALTGSLQTSRPRHPEGAPPTFVTGVDASEIPETEAGGGKYFDGKRELDPFVLMKKRGIGLVRLRAWLNPTQDGNGAPAPQGYCGTEMTLATAKRVIAAGLKLGIDFHYSNWWADPQKQITPKEWASLNHQELCAKVEEYSRSVIAALEKQGTPPTFAQAGNEVREGMLWPDGKLDQTDDSWKRFADLEKAGIRGIRAGAGRHPIQIMLHTDRGGDNKGAVMFLDRLKALGVEYDILGLSYYPWWHGTIAAMEANVNDLAVRYGKPIMIAETAYPFTLDFSGHPGGHLFGMKSQLSPGFDASPTGQRAFLLKISGIVQRIPNGLGRGVIYWAPAWIDTPKEHSGWDNLCLFDYSGKALPGLSSWSQPTPVRQINR